MTFKIDKLAVVHTDRDDTGTKIEPEEQQVTQIGSMPIHVNLGVPDFDRKNGGRPIVTQANIGTLAHIGSVKRHTSADVAAREQTTRCMSCRYFDLDLAQNKSRNPVADDTRTAVAGGLMKLGWSFQDAEAGARLAGFCKQDGSLRMPMSNCSLFKPIGSMRRALSWARDRIMRAAQGKPE